MNKYSRSRRCCILCQKTPFKVPHLRLHRFPTNEEKRNVWLNACGLLADEYSPYRSICSRHFQKSCYSKCSYRLKRDAIPTKHLKGQIIRAYFQLSEYKTIHLRLKNDELLGSLQPSISETENVGSELKHGRYFTNTETSSVKNNMENTETDTDTAKEPYKYCTHKEDKGDKPVVYTGKFP